MKLALQINEILLKDKYNISFTRLLYKIANIGTEKGKNKGEING